MSKLIEKIMLSKEYNQEHVLISKPIYASLISEMSELRGPALLPVGVRSKIGFSIFATAVIHEYADGEMIAASVAMAKRQIVEELFGEFRRPIMKVHACLSMYDTDGALAALRELEQLMFTVTLPEDSK